MYKDTKQKILWKGFWLRQQRDNKRQKIFKRAARRKQRENTERQKREQVDLGRTRGKIKRQWRHSKKENVENVFWGGNSEEIKKKGSVKMSQHKCSKKVFSDGKK